MPPRDTPLTATWNVCQNSEESTRNDVLFPDHTQQQGNPLGLLEVMSSFDNYSLTCFGSKL